MGVKRPAAPTKADGKSKRTAVGEKAASSQDGPEHDATDTDLFEGFVVTFEDPSAMLQVSSALQLKQRGRQNTSVVWSSLESSDDGFALQWAKKVSRRAGVNWVTRLLEGTGFKYRLAPAQEWPPKGLSAAPAAAPALVAQTPVAKTPVTKAAAPKTAAANTPVPSAAASSQPQASSQPPNVQPLWPQHKTLKLMISSYTARLVGPMTPEEWSQSLGEELGRGSFGVVRKVSRQGEDYAVKVMCAKHKADAFKVVGTVRAFLLN